MPGIDALMDPVRHCTRGPQGGPTVTHRDQQIRQPPDVEVGVLLPREARFWEILCGRRRANGNRHILTQSGVRLSDLGPKGVGNLVGKERSDLYRSLLIRSRTIGSRSERGDLLLQVVFGDIRPVGLGNYHEARRHRKAGTCQLTQVGSLATGLVYVAAAQLCKLFDEDHEPPLERIYPRPTYGILVAITVMVATLLSSGRLAI